MKKLFVLAGIVLALATTNHASAQRTRYYYYPQSNVYYDAMHRHYIYNDNGNWTTVRTLPSGVQLTKTRRTIYYNGPDVWRDNATHVTRYKVTHYPNGRAVGWKGTNPNRAYAKGKMKGHGHGHD